MIRTLFVGTAAAALLASAAIADPTVTATFTGVIANGTDDLGLFGEAGLDLTNVAFTATYVLNPTAGYWQNGPDYFSGVGGLSFTGGPSPVVSVQFTINGFTYSSDGSLAGQVLAGIHETLDGDEYPAEFQASGASFTDTGFIAVSNYIGEFLDRAYGDPNFAGFDGDVTDSGDNQYYNNFQYGSFDSEVGDYLEFNNTHLTIQNNGFVVPAPSPTPEPASWAMMLGGFGLIGGALRNRRRVAVRFG